jgi:phosphate transport system substrate-binding protein
MSTKWPVAAALTTLAVLATGADAGNGADKAGARATPPAPRPPAVQGDPGLAFAVADYPTTDGSTSAHPLGVLVACRLTGTDCQWCQSPGITLDEGTIQLRLLPVVRKVSSPQAQAAEALPSIHDVEMHPGLKKTWHHGTHGAYERLIKGECDLIYECRRPSADERELVKEAGVELQLTPIALDAFVFLRHADNPVKGLRAQSVRGIYTGEITSWEPLGGSGEIYAYVRNRNSGSQETMKSLVMRDLEMIEGRNMTTMSMRGPYSRLPRDPRGIGFTFFYYNERMSPNPRVKVLEIDGVAPCRRAIAAGTYPWVTEVYAVTRKDLSADAPAAKLRDWLTTPAGQAVVAESGYVPIHPVPRQMTAGELALTVEPDGMVRAGDAKMTVEELTRWLTVAPREDLHVRVTGDASRLIDVLPKDDVGEAPLTRPADGTN